jgi:citrate lyase beta subunit
VSETDAAPSIVEVIRVMVQHFGGILIEEMSGATHSDLVQWIEGGVVNIEKEAKMRTGYEVFKILESVEGSVNARRLMFGSTPLLGGDDWFNVIKQGRHNDALAAARVHMRSIIRFG